LIIAATVFTERCMRRDISLNPTSWFLNPAGPFFGEV
jgi:hypothetical protein